METRFQLIPTRAAGAPARPSVARNTLMRAESLRQRQLRADSVARASAISAHPAQGGRAVRRPLAYLPGAEGRADRSTDTAERSASAGGSGSSPAPRDARLTTRERVARRLRRFAEEERGAVTAEYAIVILAAVAFAGLLVAIMQSAEIRGMLVELVENALGSSE